MSQPVPMGWIGCSLVAGGSLPGEGGTLPPTTPSWGATSNAPPCGAASTMGTTGASTAAAPTAEASPVAVAGGGAGAAISCAASTSSATPPPAAVSASSADLRAADGAVPSKLLRATFASVALQGTLASEQGISMKGQKQVAVSPCGTYAPTSSHGLFFTPSRGDEQAWTEDSATPASSTTFLPQPVEDLVGEMGASCAGEEKFARREEDGFTCIVLIA